MPLQKHCLFRIHNRKDDHPVFVRVSALRLVNRCAPMQILHNKVADRLRLAAYDCKILAQLHALNRLIDHQRLRHQSAYGKKPRSRVKGKTCHHHDNGVHRHKRCRNIHGRIFLQHHRYDVCAAAGGVLIKEKRRSQSRKRYGIDKFQGCLIGERRTHREQRFHQIQQ